MSRLGVIVAGFFCTILGSVLLYLGATFLTVSMIGELAAVTMGSLLGSAIGWATLSYFKE